MTTTARVIRLLTEDKITEENRGMVLEEVTWDLNKWDNISKKFLNGGYLELVHPHYLPEGLVLIVDEDGISKGLPLNPHASVLYGVNTGHAIVGEAFVMTEGERGKGANWTKVLEGLPEGFGEHEMATILYNAIELQLDGK